MSQADVDLVRRGYENLNRRDVDAWLDVFHPDAEMYDLAGGPHAPARRGHAAFRTWVATMDEIWENGRHEPQQLIDAGTFVVVELRARGRWRGTGLPVDIRMFHVFEMRGHKVQRGRAFLDRGEALEAAGLEE